MRLTKAFALLALLVLSPYTQAQDFQSIFNGKDLSGWQGDKELRTVKDGVITGVTNKDAPIAHNKFIIWDGVVKDFTCKALFRLTWNNN